MRSLDPSWTQVTDFYNLTLATKKSQILKIFMFFLIFWHINLAKTATEVHRVKAVAHQQLALT